MWQFGGSTPPILNPFELSEADSLPNTRKLKELSSILTGNIDDLVMRRIYSVYKYLRGNISIHTGTAEIYKKIIQICPQIADHAKDYKEADALLRLTPGYIVPGPKGVQSIKTILHYSLVDDVDANGQADNPWEQFSPDDVLDIIQELYERFFPENGTDWPTFTDYRDMAIEVHKERLASAYAQEITIEQIVNRKPPIQNFEKFIRRISANCRGSLDPFMDGQTTANYRRRVMRGDREVEENVRFILADFAGIDNEKKKAIYMILCNEIMTRIAYASKGRRTNIIRDEAWIFLNSPICLPYITADLRLARKYAITVVTISQNYSDFKLPVMQNNTQIWIVCKLGSEDEIALANQRFKFTPEEIRFFTDDSIMGTQADMDGHTGEVTDMYSRVMIKTDAGKFFVKNKIGKEIQWVFTTNETDVFVFNYYEAKFPEKSVLDLCKWLPSKPYLKDPELLRLLRDSGRKAPDI
ncbi:MAG: hypothetical protein EOP06_02815 [Proteobacteria bacterium]|nr:MAG: hypothetical protein EOP06_02815 [Pseudomonadota bacterium]